MPKISASKRTKANETIVAQHILKTERPRGGMATARRLAQSGSDKNFNRILSQAKDTGPAKVVKIRGTDRYSFSGDAPQEIKSRSFPTKGTAQAALDSFRGGDAMSRFNASQAGRKFTR